MMSVTSGDAGTGLKMGSGGSASKSGELCVSARAVERRGRGVSGLLEEGGVRSERRSRLTGGSEGEGGESGTAGARRLLLPG